MHFHWFDCPVFIGLYTTYVVQATPTNMLSWLTITMQFFCEIIYLRQYGMSIFISIKYSSVPKKKETFLLHPKYPNIADIILK